MVAGPKTAPDQPFEEMGPDLQDELLQYPGKWVAISDGKLLAVSESSAEAYEAARAKGAQVPMLYHVPQPGARSYYY